MTGSDGTLPAATAESDSPSEKPVSCATLAKKWIDRLETRADTPTDLSTNPEQMVGFGS